MNTHDNDGRGPKRPPTGLLAKEVMEKATPDKVPVFPTIDANYREPTQFSDYIKRRDEIGKDAHDAADVVNEYSTLVNDLLVRVKQLEEALMPFATHALMLANMQMCLQAEGRGNEPAGGCWTNGLQSANLQSNAHIFFIAADIVGRATVEARVMKIFEEIQRGQLAALERDKHVADNKLEGPVGGPVTGRTH